MTARKSLASFTLIELLVVMAITSILILLAAPAVSGAIRSSKLSSAGNSLVDGLNLARQTAMARNSHVEFRFYELPAVAATPTSTPTTFRAFQIFSLDSDGTQTNAITKVTFLPDSVMIISGNNLLSSLLPTSPSNPPYSVSGTTAGQPLGVYPTSSYSYMDFHFKPNGSTDLNPTSSSNWFVSLVNIKDPIIGANGLPANFFTVQVDAQSGRVRSFRPH